MIDASHIGTLEAFGKLRRGLNLLWVKEVAAIGLGTKQAIFLMHLAKRGFASQADLSRATLTDPAAVNRALDSLGKKGWVERTDDPKDRRCWIVRLTPEGNKVAKKVERIYRKVAESVFSAINDAERKRFHSTISQLIETGLPEDIRKELSL